MRLGAVDPPWRPFGLRLSPVDLRNIAFLTFLLMLLTKN
jgi:hypothetical protein